jgi:hypothetical protein
MSCCTKGGIVTRYRIWILKLVPNFRFGGLFSAVVIFCSLYSFFRLGVGEDGAVSTPALFFSLIIAYIIPVFSFITARADEALTELMPLLPKNGKALHLTRSRLHTVSLRALFLQLIIGVFLGLAHLSLIRGSVTQMLDEMLTDFTALLSTCGALLVWTVMVTVTSMLVQQAVLFAKLGANEVRISLLNTQGLLAFGRVAIYSSLAIIGALALFPLMGFDGQLLMAEGLPGAIVQSVSLLILFVIPVWPIHRRLSVLKTKALRSIAVRLEAFQGEGECSDLTPERMAELAPILAYRREITQLSTWPFDVSSLTRLLLYLVIVPLTWAGAALIERLVDSIV